MTVTIGTEKNSPNAPPKGIIRVAIEVNFDLRSRGKFNFTTLEIEF